MPSVDVIEALFEPGVDFDFEGILRMEDKAAEQAQGNIPNARLPGGGLSKAAKKDFRRGTVVCRHWLKGLCMKGDVCEFLHQMDTSKMPECRWGTDCQIEDCPFRHVKEEDRIECTFYRQGFCTHGPLCRYRHIKRSEDETPEIADFSSIDQQHMAEAAKKQKIEEPNEYFKIALCKHFEQDGICPYGDACHFAHGKAELRAYPGKKVKKKEPEAPPAANPLLDLPDKEGTSAYFVVKSSGFNNLGLSIKVSKWATHMSNSDKLNAAFRTHTNVVLLFSVKDWRHFQGCARMTSEVSGTGPPLSFKPGEEAPPPGYFTVEWLRLAELPFGRVMDIYNPLAGDRPVIFSGDMQEVAAPAGMQLVRIFYAQQPLMLSTVAAEFDGNLDLQMQVKRARPQGQDGMEVDQGAGGRAEFWEGGDGLDDATMGSKGGGRRLPVSTAGFMFTTSVQTHRESFQRRLVALPWNQSLHDIVKAGIAPGTVIFVTNTTERRLYGIYEADSPMKLNMEPAAFTGNNPSQPSPLPIQVRFRVALDAPPILEQDPAVRAVLGEGEKVRQLTQAETQQLADVFSERFHAVKVGMAFPPGMVMPCKPGYPPGGVGSTQDFSPSGPLAPGQFKETIYIGIENETGFKVGKRIIGQQGVNMKRVTTSAGGSSKLRLRGKATGFLEGPSKIESPEPIQLCIYGCDNEESFKTCSKLAHELVDGIRTAFVEYVRNNPRGFKGDYNKLDKRILDALNNGTGYGGGPAPAPPQPQYPPRHPPQQYPPRIAPPGAPPPRPPPPGAWGFGAPPPMPAGYNAPPPMPAGYKPPGW